MPNIFKQDKNYIINMLKRKNQCLITINGEILTPEELEELDIDNCYIDLHA